MPERNGAYFTAAGVPLRNIATNLSAFAERSMRPPLVIPWTIKMPNTGIMTILTSVTASMAIIGSRDSGRGTRRRANDAPSMMSASGTAILPTNDAGNAE